MLKTLLMVLVGLSMLTAGYLLKPINPYVQLMPINEAKLMLNNYINQQSDSDWTVEKIEFTEQKIKENEQDENFRIYLLTQLRQVKLEVYANDIFSLKTKISKENLLVHSDKLNRYGFIPPLDRSDRVFTQVRPEIERFILEQENKEQLMKVAQAAQSALHSGTGWQPIINALDDCGDWRCQLILDMTFNTPKRMRDSMNQERTGAY